MEILDNPAFKSKYQKHKLRVKLWESDFIEKHGRRPNKNDIKEADTVIKESYKMYWKLKTRALEETLMDITFSDDVSNTSIQSVTEESPGDVKKSFADTTAQDNNGPTETTEKKDNKPEANDRVKDAENIDPHNGGNVCEPVDSSAKTSEFRNLDGVWGSHLSKSNEQPVKKKTGLLVGRFSSFQLSQDKFSSFTKRNPRKSLSSSMLGRSKSDKSTSVSAASKPEASEQAETVGKQVSDLDEETRPMFGQSVKVTYAEAKSVGQSVNAVQNLMEGHMPVNRNLNQGWLERCSRQSNLEYPASGSQRLSATSDSGVESMESSIHSPSYAAGSGVISDEEDFICNSDTEEEHRNKRVRNFKKRPSDQDSRPAKRLCTDDSISNHSLVDNSTINPAYSGRDVDAREDSSENRLDTFASMTTVDTPIDRTMERIADSTGKLSVNENVESVGNNSVCETEPANIDADVPKSESDDDVPLSRRKVVRRTKKAASKNPDDPKDTGQTARKKTTRKPKEAGTTRKTSKKVENDTNEKSSSKAKGTRKRVTKKVVEAEEEDESESKNIGTPIYGVETLKTVPRFAVRATGAGGLIEQFSETICSTNGRPDNVTVKQPKGKLSDKEKLEKKVADGKVNENFVRINLKKKVFVRGKKNFNFSKYKKNQWKQRKKELGSGSGSLDVADLMEKNGNIKACFNCGDVGHFSRYCPNRKGSELISLEEMDESSVFPTLEEAQQMASQNALAAHASRVDRLPEKPSYVPSNERETTEEEAQKEEALNEEVQKEEVHNEEALKEEAQKEEAQKEEAPKEAQESIDDLWEHVEDEDLMYTHKIPEDLVAKLLPPPVGEVNSLYNTKEDGSLIETPPEVYETLHKFGHEAFRAGQEKAVMRILSGLSTLVTLSTGSGKSLCYQLPAYLYSKRSHCITLVISPLVSLMDDQVTGVPSFLSAACLHTNQTPKTRDTVMEMVKRGQVDVLLVSPEAVVAGEKSTGFGALLRQLPPIAFACIDEAHCISQWSHNFRPSYLMVCRVLKEKFKVRTVLALTATATRTTAESIVSHLGIPDGMAGVISDIPVPRNLLLTVSKDMNRDYALVSLFRSERFEECDSVIVYCTRREECSRIAALLRTSLQDAKYAGNQNAKVSAIAEAYHAGLSAHRRKVVQKAFMSGETRIVVATIAFGMGLNKADIRAVIHYNMPSTFEGYVQEIGRAGRDGLRSHCHLFLSPTEDCDKWELKRHIYANGVDRHTVRRLLQKVFLPCSCAKLRTAGSNRRCPGHEVAIPVDETVSALDISEETISTLLCYLELHPKRFINVLSSVYVRATISSYSGPQGLKQAAQSSPPLAMAIALDLQRGISHEDSNVIEFPVIDVASAIGWDSGIVKSHLKSLEWKTVNGAPKRSAISVRYDTLGLRVRAPGDLNEAELDEALDALFSRAQSQEATGLRQLDAINEAMHKFAVPTVEGCSTVDETMIEKSESLKEIIRNYFASDGNILNDVAPKRDEKGNEAEIAGDVRALVLSYRDINFTGRTVARIFYGIQSPNYPAYMWSKCRFWRAHLSSDFTTISQIATREILALR